MVYLQGGEGGALLNQERGLYPLQSILQPSTLTPQTLSNTEHLPYLQSQLQGWSLQLGPRHPRCPTNPDSSDGEGSQSFAMGGVELGGSRPYGFSKHITYHT